MAKYQIAFSCLGLPCLVVLTSLVCFSLSIHSFLFSLVNIKFLLVLDWAFTWHIMNFETMCGSSRLERYITIGQEEEEEEK